MNQPIRNLLSVYANGFTKNFLIKLDSNPINLLLGLAASEIAPVDFVIFRHTKEDLAKLQGVYRVLLNNLSELRSSKNVKVHIVDTFKLQADLASNLPAINSGETNSVNADYLEEYLSLQLTTKNSCWLSNATLSDLYLKSSYETPSRIRILKVFPLQHYTLGESINDLLKSKEYSASLTKDLIKLIENNYNIEALSIESRAIRFMENAYQFTFNEQLELFFKEDEDVQTYLEKTTLYPRESIQDLFK